MCFRNDATINGKITMGKLKSSLLA